MTIKPLKYALNQFQKNWVGDGFHVYSVFNYHDLGPELSPFLLMDYNPPLEFKATTKTLGVGPHPHRGFETVTLAFSGEIEHRDSAGGGGIIKAGDVQWMTAGSGLVHQEKHSKNFAKAGGQLEFVQLWINLPASQKMVTPRYQGLKAEQFPIVKLAETSYLRLIAGSFESQKGPAQTWSDIQMYDLYLKNNERIQLPLIQGQTALLLLRKGSVQISQQHQNKVVPISFKGLHLLVFDREIDGIIELSSLEEAEILFLAGTPFPEKFFAYGPFVMNSKEEIIQAFQDYESGKMGEISSIEGSEN